MPSYTYQNKRGKILLGHEIGKGGEAVVYEIQNAPEVAKIYHPNKLPPAEKLSIMVANPPDDPTLALNHVSIAWMTDLIENQNQDICGYVMPRIAGAVPIHKLYNPKARRSNFSGFNWKYLHRTARNLASAVAAIHAKGYVIGDLNESNILVQPTALVTLIDTDSFQVINPKGQTFRCLVGKPDYTAPEIQGGSFSSADRTKEHDQFALAVLIFLLLMEGSHPFRGADPPEIGERIRHGLFPYSSRTYATPPPMTLPFEALHPELREKFELCFVEGDRNPYMRPKATEWLAALKKAENELIVCQKNPCHYYTGTQASCTWCERKALLKYDPFPDVTSASSKIPTQKPLPSVQSNPAPTSAPIFPSPSLSIPLQPPSPPKKPKSKARIFVVLMILFGIGYCNINQRIERTDQRIKEIAVQKERESQEKERKRLVQEEERRRQEEKQKKPLINRLGMKFVYIPPGTFMMGSPPDEPDRRDDETQHKVTLNKGFYMQTTEVTQGQWKAVMGNNPSYFQNCGDGCPVEQVSWNDVQNFIKKLNKKEGADIYRLPTEAEWEYAARAGSNTAIYTGDIKILGSYNASALDPIAWYGGNSCAEYIGGYDCSGWQTKQYPCQKCGTHPVGKKEPNDFGLYDMLGNVWEWCQDWYGDYSSAVVNDPTGSRSGTYRVLRGGGWHNYAQFCLSASRHLNLPDPQHGSFGFRIVRSLSDHKAKEALKQPEKSKPKYSLRKELMPVSRNDLGLDKDWRPTEFVRNDFKDNRDGTISDHATGLMWKKSISDKEYDHFQMNEYIQYLNREKFAGYSDWRVPTIEELMSLITENKQSNGIYINPIFDVVESIFYYPWHFWSATTYAVNANYAWDVYLNDGIVSYDYKSRDNYVWPVRSLSDQKVKEALKQAQEEERKRLESDQKAKEAIKQAEEAKQKQIEAERRRLAQEEERKRLESEQKVKEELKQVEEAKQKQIEAEHERLAQEEERQRLKSDQKAKEALKQAQEAKDRADKEERDARRIAQEEERQRAENKAERDARQIAQKEERQRAEKERKKYKPEFTNKLGMKFVYIPSGSFMMGMDKDSYEKQHKVTLTKGFYMQTIEVTQGQWKVIMGSNPSKFNDCGDNCPVEQVSWNNVQEFIKKLNRKEGTDKYRLPTEAEWEYAARAGTTTAYNWGSSADCSKANYGNYRSSYNMFSDSNISECEDKNPGKTMKVGSFDPNAFGLYDMAGNVSEWVQDIYKNVIYMSDQTDPIYTGSVPDPFRVIRGGGWGSKAQDCQSAYRNGSRRPDYRDDLVGFRLVRSQ